MSDLRTTIAQDLTAIAEMYVKLRAEAVNRAGDPDIPGGAAMVMLGPGADVEAWGYVQLSAIFGRLRLGVRGTTAHQRLLELDAVATEDVEPPLSYLASWADIVRDERGQEPSSKRAQIEDEIRYLRSALDWMLAMDEFGEPWFIQVEDFAAGLSKVRRAMENALHDGVRAERINARCRFCDAGPRLCLRRHPDDEAKDHWYCPACRHLYDAEGVSRCWRSMLVERGEAPEWLRIRAAAAAIGRSPKTIRSWTKTVDGMGNPIKPRVRSRYADDENRPTEVNWPDVRAIDDTTRRRGQYRTIAV